MATVKTNVIQIDASQASKSIKDLRNEIKELKDQMAGLDSSSDAFIEAANKAGELQHQVDEISQAVRGASSDFGDMLGNVSKVGAGLTGAFQTAAAALNLFGVESTNVTKAIQKMQNLMAITQGLSAIDAGIKAWKKFSTAVKTTTTYQKLFNDQLAITSQETKIAAVASDKLSKGMVATSAATKSASIATRAFSGALKAIGIGIALEAINLLIEGVKKLIEWMSRFNSEEYQFSNRLEKLNANLATFRGYLEDNKAITDFALSMRKGWIEIEKMNTELEKLNYNFNAYLGIQNRLSALYTASGIDNLAAQFDLLANSMSNYGEVTKTLYNSNQRIDSSRIISDKTRKSILERWADEFGTATLTDVKALSQLKDLEKELYDLNTRLNSRDSGTVKLLENKLKQVQSVSKMLKDAAAAERELTDAEQKSIRNILKPDDTESFITKIQGDYATIINVKRSVQNEIDEINRVIATLGYTGNEAKPLEQSIKILESYQTYLDDAASQLQTFISSYNTALIDIASFEQGILKNREALSREEAEIYKEQIDGRAFRDKTYKESTQYLLDQITYWEMLLKLEQDDTSNKEKIVQKIANLRYQIGLFNKELEQMEYLKASKLYVEIIPKKPEVYVDEAAMKDLQDKVQKALENLDKIVIPHITTWKDALRDLIWDVGHQFEVLTNTMSLYQESSLGLSGNYVNAANDIKKTFNQLMQNIVDGGDAGWTQWSQMAGNALQATGSMLNALSAEQDTATEEGFESQKKLQIGATVMNMLSGIMMAWSTAMELGPILGPIAGATNSALIAGIGAAQIAKIKGTTFGGEAGGGYATTGVGSLIAPVQYTASVADATKERDVRDTRVYVTEHDITDTQRRVQVAQSEARF